MFYVCPRCGEYRPDQIVEPEGPAVVCPVCACRRSFARLPLLAIGGPSGGGKSTTLWALAGRINGALALDADILWRPEFDRPEENYRDFFETWLRLALNIGQSGKPVAIFGGGFAVPANVENCVARRYFSAVHYLALVCDDETLAARLKARPAWRDSSNEAFISAHIGFNHWLKENAEKIEPGISLLDTTRLSVEETAARTAQWVAACSG
jgi:energy-coupling factor transporter ATP-binding protein EcfA2